MRKCVFISFVLLAACGGGEAEENKAAPKAARIAAGQWELASEVTALTSLDQGSPKIDTPVGTRATETVCVGAGRPPPAFFSGEEYRCASDNYYVRNGRMNVTLRCTREGLSGNIAIMADGRFDEESVEYDRDVTTALASDGDVRIVTHITGRRLGECQPEAADEGGNQSGGQ